MDTKDFDFEIKDVSKTGTFVGYGSVFGNVDQGDDIVQKGAFAESLLGIAAKNRKVPILWQHRSGEPVGGFESIKEDGRGLLMEGKLLVDDVQRAKEAHALLQAGVVSGLSIGYTTRDHSFDQKTGIRTLKKLDLLETSIVTFPMNDEARVTAVKSFDRILKTGNLPGLPEFEDFLREAGFSKTQAAVIAGRGPEGG